MKAILKEIVEAVPAIEALSAAKLPVKAAYAVSKLAKAMQKEVDDYNEARAKIFKSAGCTIEEYTAKATDGAGKLVDAPAKRWIHSDKDVMAKCIAEGNELLAAETTLAALPLDIEQFGNAEVPGGAFFGLEWAMKKD